MSARPRNPRGKSSTNQPLDESIDAFARRRALARFPQVMRAVHGSVAVAVAGAEHQHCATPAGRPPGRGGDQSTNPRSFLLA
jgi:hypothetical protein